MDYLKYAADALLVNKKSKKGLICRKSKIEKNIV